MFGDEGLRFGDWGLGLRVGELRFRVQGVGFGFGVEAVFVPGPSMRKLRCGPQIPTPRLSPRMYNPEL